MTNVAVARPETARFRLIRGWLATGVVDGVWAVVLTLAYGRSVTRLWQGLTATVFDDRAYDGGLTTVALGIAIHFSVALAWSAIFLVLLLRTRKLEEMLDSPSGIFTLGAIYGPFIWIVMSRIVIPISTHKEAAPISVRWWIQLVGHAAFVGMPMMWGLRRRRRD